ncbi:hypothetical protein LJC46_07715 [Desulfovibrio sp. OttesenSCG-928-G15]|nr:hypothetical protein [Desulfovibrio sp. OttesenSCG-928-G15]
MLGLLRGDFSLINSLWLTFAFSTAAGGVLYAMAFLLVKDRLLSVIFVLLVFLHRDMLDNVGRPITDMTMFFFVCCAALAQLRGKVWVSALLFGCGYLFREVIILFFPLLIFLNPKTTNLRTYCKNGLICFVVFLPFFLIARFANTLFDYGNSAQDFYLHFTQYLLSVVSFEWLGNLLNHIRIFFKQVALIPLLLCVCFWKRISVPGKRMMVVGLLYGLIVCVLCSYTRSMPERYFLPSIPLLTLAALTAVVAFSEKKRIATGILCIALLIASGRVYRSPALLRTALADGKTPITAARLTQAPMHAAQVFLPGSVLLSYGQGLYVAPDAVHVMLPPLEEFMAADNRNIDGVLLMTTRGSWKTMLAEDSFTDSHGNTFTKVNLGALPLGHKYFKRER